MEYEDDLIIEEFTDVLDSSMAPYLLDWTTIDRMSYAEPSSKKTRKLQRKMKLTGRSARFYLSWRKWGEEE